MLAQKNLAQTISDLINYKNEYTVRKEENRWFTNHLKHERLKEFRNNLPLRQLLLPLYIDEQDNFDNGYGMKDASEEVFIHWTKPLVSDPTAEEAKPFLHKSEMHEEHNSTAFFARIQSNSTMHEVLKATPSALVETLKT